MLIVISLSNLAAMCKIQKNMYTKVRPVTILTEIQSNNKRAPNFESGLLVDEETYKLMIQCY